MLSQEEDGIEYVVAYYSRKLSPAERNYCVTRRKLLAVVKSLDHFHSYLYGAQFKIRTDHAALRWLKSLKNPEGQLARWIGKLEQHNYSIEHRPGRAHGNANSLSRRPCDPGCKHCGKREDPVPCGRVTLENTLTGISTLREKQLEDEDLRPVLELLDKMVQSSLLWRPYPVPALLQRSIGPSGTPLG